MVADLHASRPSTDGDRDRGAVNAPTPLRPAHPDVPCNARLMNWRDFHTQLQRAAIAATQTGAPLSLLMLERAGSDGINQPHGSPVVAAAMRGLAGLVRAALGERGLLARYSEARLALILTDTDLGEAVRQAERIAHQASSHCGIVGGIDLEATAAIGVAQFQDDESLGHLIQRTAEALKQARSRRGLLAIADHAASRRPSRLRHVRLA